MAKKPSIVTVSTGYKATDTVNANFTSLRNAFDNTLSLDGSVPNAMEADLDMNNNDILNVKDIYVDNIIYEGALPIANGGTGADNATDARENLGIRGFRTISVSGESNVVADEPYDTLTLVAGNNITIETNASSDQITISQTDVPYTKNYNWMGFFGTWQNGHAFKTDTATRQIGTSGATFARVSFTDDQVTMYHIKGVHQSNGIRIQRNNTNTATASATMVMNFTQEETKPLLGKTVCLQLHALKSSSWSGSGLKASIYFSREPQQPITRADGKYSSGHELLEEDTFTLDTDMPAKANPFYFSAFLPENAVQMAIVITVPWSGTAGADDYVDIEGVFLTLGNSPITRVLPETFSELLQKAKTRYQTTYPYSAARGVLSKAGSIRAVAVNTSATTAVIVPVRFDPPMAVIPQVLMQSPLSGTENRWENETTGVYTNGLPYNLSEQGVTLQNNGAVTAGDVLLCHWTARCVF